MVRASGRRLVGIAVAAAMCAGALFAPAASADSKDIPRDELKKLMNELVGAGAAGVQINVHNGMNGFSGAAGTQQLGKKDPVSVTGRFRAGSITKTVVAAAVLKLVNDGELGLDDPVKKYLKRLDLDEAITVRMLLNHTSGIFNYTGDFNGDGTFEPGIPVYGEEYVKNIKKSYRPTELVKLALSKPPRFMPGTKWQYSNTNYILAGMIIEQIVTSKDYDEVLAGDVLKPLKMNASLMPGNEETMPDPHAHGYIAYDVTEGETTRHVVADVSEADMTYAGAAGALVTTAGDLDKLITRLLDGTALKPRMWAEMTKFVEADGMDYGLGLMRLELPAECGGTMYGHTGGVPGYRTMMFSNADRTKRLQFSVTTGDLDQTNAEAMIKFSEAEQRIATLALCGKADVATSATVKIPMLP